MQEGKRWRENTIEQLKASSQVDVSFQSCPYLCYVRPLTNTYSTLFERMAESSIIKGHSLGLGVESQCPLRELLSDA